MRRACVIGHPVAHSRSPLIHRHWLAAYRIDGDYVREDVKPEDFDGFIATLAERGYVGANVTVPNKEAAFRSLARAEPVAAALKAANTVWLEEGRLAGTNTDVYGFLAHIDETLPGWDVEAEQAVVLGAGGAARAIVYALLQRDFSRVVVVNRTRGRAEAICTEFGARTTFASFEELPAWLKDADILVNATTLGMSGQPPLHVDLAPMQRGAIVYDVVYVPLETPLLAAARARGLRTVDGLGMLLHQAVPGFEKWFGVRPAVTPELREALLADLREKERDRRMIVLGLTGSAAMGKSATAQMFADEGVPVFDADGEVHRLYAGKATPLIDAAFPGVVVDGVVDREKLAAKVLGKPEALATLEAIVHPLVRESEEEFRNAAQAKGASVAVLNTPLLFETGGDKRVDAVVVVTAPEEVQRKRLLERPNMTEEKIRAMLARQIPDSEKRRRADFLIDTSRGFDAARADVKKILREIAERGLPARRK